MTRTMLERLARTLAASFHPSSVIDATWPGYVPAVLNILSELRTPDEGMTEAAYRRWGAEWEALTGQPAPRVITVEAGARLNALQADFTAMIDDVIGKKP